VVVVAYHSWRTQAIWTSSSQWTAEDQQASDGGKFDDRPGYIIKLPGQSEAARIDSRFAAVHTRALLQGILSGKIRTAQGLAAFARDVPAPREQPHVPQETRSIAQIAR